MKAILYIRSAKKCTRALEMEVPDNAIYVKVPVFKTDFYMMEGMMVQRPGQSILVFNKVDMDVVGREVMGNMFLCDLPDVQRRGLAL